MKIRTFLVWTYVFSAFFGYHLIASDSRSLSVPKGWIDATEVHISDRAFYIDTNLGVVELTVLDYDEENERYLVECIKYGESFYPSPEEFEFLR